MNIAMGQIFAVFINWTPMPNMTFYMLFELCVPYTDWWSVDQAKIFDVLDLKIAQSLALMLLTRILLIMATLQKRLLGHILLGDGIKTASL